MTFGDQYNILIVIGRIGTWYKQGAIQVLRNADGVGGVSDFLEKSVTKV